jgi:hypothetical protein
MSCGLGNLIAGPFLITSLPHNCGVRVRGTKVFLGEQCADGA